MFRVRAHLLLLLAGVVWLGATGVAEAQPTQVSYQGQLKSNGTPFTGNATMKFAIVSGTTTLWSNDSTSAGGSEPTNGVGVSVSNGLFTVQLGASPMKPLTASALGPVTNAVLRVWVSTGGAFEQLSDQPLSSAAFALRSESAASGGGWTESGGNVYRLTGNVGIGTAAPLAISGYGASLNIASNAGGTLVLQDPNTTTGYRVKWLSNQDGVLYYGRAGDGGASPVAQMAIDQGGNLGLGTVSPISISGYGAAINVAGNTGGTLVLQDANTTTGYKVKWLSTQDGVLYCGRASDNGTSPVAQLVIDQGGNVGIGTATPSARLDVVGTARAQIVEITGGSDLAEPFDVASTSPEIAPQPGMVVAIDPSHPAKLRLADQPYDARVAGVISGANGLSPGLVMRGSGKPEADGEHSVALSGRVWCWVDASLGAVHPGDLLTTSGIPGVAMAASDRARRPGAILGKAMTALERGRGLVLVLVSLQ